MNCRFLRNMALIMASALIVALAVMTAMGKDVIGSVIYHIIETLAGLSFLAYYLKKGWGDLRYLLRNIAYPLMSLPYGLIIWATDCQAPLDVGYILTLLPLIAAIMTIASTVSKLSEGRYYSSMVSYISVVIMAVILSALLFFQREHQINARVYDFAQALWWSGLQVTTVGSPIAPMSVVGKVMAFVLSSMGMMMFPLFTVYVTRLIKKLSGTEKITVESSKFAGETKVDNKIQPK